MVKAPNVESPAVKEAIGQLKWRALYRGVMYEPIDVDVNEAKTVANISIPVEGNGTDSTSNKALAALRDEIVPVTVGSVPDAVVGVTGETAQSKDFNDQMKTVAPLVFGFVLLFAFVLMLLSFRSLVIAAKTIVLNLLSVGAAYGILVLVFQHGWGKQLLGFEFTGGIDPFLPILLFVILFGLSMDYHVFVLSRVREGYESGMTTDEAVAHGIKSTAGVVTSAAIVMVGVFAIFATLQMMIFKQFGVGLASAILIDATMIRAILLPATMKLLGDWNWYLPKWLEWLPRLEHEEGAGSTGRAGGRGLASVVDRRSSVGRLAQGRCDTGRSGPAHRGRAGPARPRGRLPPRRRRQLPAAEPGHLGRRPPRQRPRPTRAPRPGRRRLPATARGRARDDRAPGRLLRRPRRNGGRPLHEGGRCVRRRLHRAAVDPGRVCCSSASAPSRCGGRGEPTTDSGGGTCAGSCSSPARSSPQWPCSFRSRSPTSSRTRPARTVPTADLGAPYENVEFTTTDGLRLKGWYIPSRNGAAVISFPGRASSQKRAKLLARHGYGVLLFDRRGEGESEGDPNAFGWQGERDIHAAVAFLQRQPDVDPERIGGIGLSVGGEMMIEAAAESSDLKAIVSEGASSRSVRDEIANGSGWQELIGNSVATAATAVFTNNLPPSTLKSLVPKISGAVVLRLRRARPAGRAARQPGVLRSRARTQGDLGGAGLGAHRRHRGTAGGVRAPRHGVLRPLASASALGLLTFVAALAVAAPTGVSSSQTPPSIRSRRAFCGCFCGCA